MQELFGTYAGRHDRNEDCWCHDKPGHPLRRITWSEQGVSRSKAIPEEDVVWIKGASKNYKDFRVKRKQIQHLERDLKALLETHEKEVVRKKSSSEEIPVTKAVNSNLSYESNSRQYRQLQTQEFGKIAFSTCGN